MATSVRCSEFRPSVCSIVSGWHAKPVMGARGLRISMLVRFHASCIELRHGGQRMRGHAPRSPFGRKRGRPASPDRSRCQCRKLLFKVSFEQRDHLQTAPKPPDSTMDAPTFAPKPVERPTDMTTIELRLEQNLWHSIFHAA